VDDVILWFVPIFVISIAAELLWSIHRNREIYETRDTLACFGMGLGNVAVNVPMKLFWLWLYGIVYQFRILEVPISAWWGWILLLIADDFVYYWFHRLHHTVRLLWCTHSNHHSSQHFNLAVALRQPWTEALTAYWFWLPLPLLGFHPLAVILMQSLSLIYQFFVHTESVRTLGMLEWVFNTPSHHRAHHGSNPQYIDRNYGGIFIVWDRLFASFEPEVGKVRYGLTRNLETFNPVRIAFHEWAALLRDLRQAPNLRSAWHAVAKPPGYASGQ
jgi:sterol desaturase/sphingolipid hydroxylase (fatty acid hydroxylase superfamily)